MSTQPTSVAIDTPLYAVEIDGKWGYIDKTGTMAIPPEYREVFLGFSEGLAPVQSGDDLWGYIDPTGRMVVEPQYLDVRPFHEGLAAVGVVDSSSRKPWKCGFIDKKGTMVIPAQYDDVFY
ncbi:MAG: WG repeat-containing protein [Armatimonadetes bacterium]|nr:WG repeat-containing protein [Armatimonadota bacterium]